MSDPIPKVGYLVKTFPKISETFILREVLALEAAGVTLEIFALRRPGEKKIHSLAAQVLARVNYIPSRLLFQPLAMLWPQLLLLLTQPLGYLRAARFAWRHRPGANLKDFFQAGCLARLLARRGIHHLHVHFINKPATIAELVRLMIGTPLSITAHAKDIYLSDQAELRRKMARAKFIVTCNDYNRRYLQQHVAADGPPVLRIYHGLDANLFYTNGAERESANAPLILSVGRLREKKGFPTLLAACRLLKIAGRKFHCVIVGYGPLQEELERQIDEFELRENVALTGMLTQDEVIALYKRATLFVLPCQVTEDGDRDGIPNVLAEAMAMELPVISTPVAGIPELIESLVDGLLVRPEDPGGLAAAMTRLLEQPQLRRRLGQAARGKVHRLFSAQRNAEQLQALFLSAMQQAPVAAASDEAGKPLSLDMLSSSASGKGLR